MTEGYDIPLHRSLTEPVMMAGAPRGAAIVAGTAGAAIGLGLQLWLPGLLIWVIGHSAAVALARRDPDFVRVTARAIRHREHLSC